MGERIQAFDWSKTPLGSVESWSPALRMAVRLMLANRLPMLLWWGPQYVSIYNDPYRPVLGNKHPWALGLPVSECWKEIWHVLKPLIDTPFQGGPATWNEDILLVINRYGFNEETHWLIAYSPAPDESVPSGIGGVLATVHENTAQVLSERRLAALRDLGSRTDGVKSAELSCRAVAGILEEYSKDIPFALLYLTNSDGRHARLAATASVQGNQDISPAVIDLDATENAWPLGAAKRSMQPQVLTDLGTHFSAIPSGPWADPPTTAVILPMSSGKQRDPSGFLVVGISSHLQLDDAYRGFLDLATTQIATAISNARSYEEEKQRAESLAELDRAKTVFFSNVSHEFRTPLTLMLAPVEDALAGSEGPLPPLHRERLELIYRNGLRLQRLVNSLLDFSRIGAGRVRATYQPTELAEFTADLASNFRSACEKAGLKLRVECPPLAEPVFVDRSMWEKIVLNLLSNAFKFTFQGEIAVSMHQTDHAAELRVRDTGTGIPAAEMPRIFERFHRVENARGRTHEGSGIGLALVQELVNLHGGSISAASEIGKGTIFNVSIPLGIEHLPHEQVASGRAAAHSTVHASPYVEEALPWLPDTEQWADPGSEGSSSVGTLIEPSLSSQSSADDRPRVLVADDNADMRRYLVRLLSKQYVVEAVSDGAEALDAVRQHSPDLILSDVMMPRVDGFELLRSVRSDAATAGVPVILLSARAGEESRMAGMHGRADDYLVKPFRAKELLARVESLLQIKRLRQEADEALRQSEEKYRTLFDTMDEGFVVIEVEFNQEGRAVDYRHIEANRAFEKHTGLRDHLGQSVRQTVPGLEEFWFVTYGRVAATGEPTRFEHRAGPLGDRWFDVYASRLGRPGGNRVAVLFTDITARRRSEEAIRASEVRHSFLVKLTDTIRPLSDPVVVQAEACRVLGEHLQANRVVYFEIRGDEYIIERDYTAGVRPLAGRYPVSSFGPALLAELLAGRTVVESDATSKSGRVPDEQAAFAAIHVRGHVDVPLVKDGRFVAGLTVHVSNVRDWTPIEIAMIEDTAERTWAAVERVRAEAALRASEEQRRLALDAAELGAWHVDPGSNTLMADDRFQVIIGVKGQVLTYEQAMAAIHPDDQQRVRDAVADATRLDNPTPYAIEYRVIHADESVHWIFGKGRANFEQRDSGRKLVSFDGTVNDITARKLIEQEREQLVGQLRDADRRKDEFLATLAHELRNPLAPIRNGLQILRMANVDSDAAKQARAMMERQLSQMVRLIDDLLDLSRISRGKIELRRERVELAKIIQHAVETSCPVIEASGHDLTISVPPDPICVDADVTRLAQVFSNLLNNAAKYTDPGGRIHLSVQRRGGEVIVSVKDNGLGIPAHMLRQVFEMFTQVDRHLERSQGGLGIGLSIVKRLVEMHDGSISVESDGPSTGSEFTVRLPVVLPMTQPTSGDEEPGFFSGRRRILVVDDNLDAAMSLAMMLELMGNEVNTAHDGLEALDVAAAYRPDLILLDIGMPRLNGHETARRIRKEPWGQGVVLVALTGWGQEEDRLKSKQAGFDSHMVKPVEPAALEKLLANLQEDTA